MLLLKRVQGEPSRTSQREGSHILTAHMPKLRPKAREGGGVTAEGRGGGAGSGERGGGSWGALK